MISRIFTSLRLPSSVFMFPSTLTFSFAAQYRRKSRQSIVRPENCNNLSELIYFISNNGGLNEDLLNNVLERASKLRNTLNPSDNTYHIQKLVEGIDVEKLPLEGLANVASIYQIFKINRYRKLNEKFEALSTAIDKRSQDFQKLNPESLIFLIQFSQELGKFQRLNKLNSILQTKIPQLRYGSYPRVLEHFAKVKFPNGLQKAIWGKFFEKYSTQFFNFDNKFLITHYKSLKKMNPFIYKLNDIVELIEKKLKNEIDDLDQKSILNLLSYRSPDNIFTKILFRKVIESVEEDGGSFLDSELWFKIIIRICSEENFRLGFKDEQKVLNLIMKNLEQNSRMIIELVKRNFFTKKQIEQIVEKITEKSCEDAYFKNSGFVFELIERNIFLKDNFAAYIESRKELVPGEAVTPEFIYFALIIERLHSKDRKDTKIKQIYDKIVQNLPQSVQASLKNWTQRDVPEHSLLVAFNVRYYSSFYANFIKAPLKQQVKQVPLSVIKYLLASNRYNDLQKILTDKSNFNQKKIYQLIDLVEAKPQRYTGCFSTVNKLLIKFLENQPAVQGKEKILNSKFLRYICNWEIHEALNVEQVSSLVSLARLVVDKYLGKTLKGTMSNAFIGYILQSPCESLKNTNEYVEFLKQVQEKIVEGGEGNKINYPKFILLREIIKNNIIQKQFASHLLSSNAISNQSHYYQILETANGKQFNVEANQQIQITSENILKILRNKKVPVQFLISKFEEIIKTIDKMESNGLVNLLFNFGLRTSQKSYQILHHIMKKIVDNGKPVYIQKIPTLFANLEYYNLRTNEYKNFLKYILEGVTKNIDALSMQNHNQLINECLTKSVDCEQYAKKLNREFNNRLKAFEISSKGEKHLALRLFSLNPKDGLLNFIDCIKYSHASLKQEMLNYLILGDFEDEKSRVFILNYFKNNNGIVINKGIFEFLSAKIPELKGEGIKVQIDQKNLQNYFQQKLKKYLEENKIEFTRLEKNGHEGILTNSKTFIYFFKDRHNQILQKALNAFLTFNFQLEENQKIVVIFTNQKTSKLKNNAFSRVLSEGVEQLKGQRDKLLVYIQQREKKEEKPEATQ